MSYQNVGRVAPSLRRLLLLVAVRCSLFLLECTFENKRGANQNVKGTRSEKKQRRGTRAGNPVTSL